LATTTRQVAFGGMMTLLDASGTTTTTDTTGPTSTITGLSPDPALATNTITVTANFTDPTVAGQGGPSAITAAEVLLDGGASAAVGTSPWTFTTPGGSGTSVTGATATIPSSALAGLPQGTHTVYVRAQDAAGNWGALTSRTFTLAATGAATTGVGLNPNPANGLADATNLANPTGDLRVTATGDDTALGGTVTGATATLNGVGYPMTLSVTGATITAESVTIPAAVINALAEGSYPVNVTTTDSVYGLPGPAGTATLVVDKTGPTGRRRGLAEPQQRHRRLAGGPDVAAGLGLVHGRQRHLARLQGGGGRGLPAAPGRVRLRQRGPTLRTRDRLRVRRE